MSSARVVLLLALFTVSGCSGAGVRTAPPLGRSLGTRPEGRVAAPTGDPPGERNGTIPQDPAADDDKPTATPIAPSPQGALRRFALVYTNWQAAHLLAHEHELTSLAIGAARLAVEQTYASESGITSLAANHVQNEGVVLAIAPGQETARNQWVVVTQEQTAGIGPYAGLPTTVHVTLSRVARLGRGWAVSEWSPRS